LPITDATATIFALHKPQLKDRTMHVKPAHKKMSSQQEKCMENFAVLKNKLKF